MNYLSSICVQVDDVNYSETNWTNRTESVLFSEDCSGLTYVPDDAFEKLLQQKGLDDKTDNYVLTSNMELVKILDFGDFVVNQPRDPGDERPELFLQDLTGLEVFWTTRLCR